MRLASFRLPDDAPDVCRAGLVLGWGHQSWVHSFDEGTDLSAILMADPQERERAADAAASSDGFRFDRVVILRPLLPTAIVESIEGKFLSDGTLEV